jgi:hypothetical protein
MNKKDSEKTSFSYSDIIKITISLLILGNIFFLKYIFPKSPFVSKYFSGRYALLWFILFWVILFIVDIYIPKKKRKRRPKEK